MYHMTDTRIKYTIFGSATGPCVSSTKNMSVVEATGVQENMLGTSGVARAADQLHNSV